MDLTQISMTADSSLADARTGHVARINGPVVHIVGLGRAVRHEFVEVGDDRLPGEIITVDRDLAIAQVYEYTGGLAVGQLAWAHGRPLSVQLGPGLLGGIYDGLLRPLDDAGEFLPPRGLVRPAITTHRFEPRAVDGDVVGEGDVLGATRGIGGFEHLVLVPPGTHGRIDEIAAAGSYETTATVAIVGGTPVCLASEWPIRKPRPAAAWRTDREPFVTGQRVLDVLHPIAKGSSATVIGGFGEGKTMLLQQLAKWGDADIIIYVGCGERGNELADLIEEMTQLEDPRSSRPLLERTIVIANTSNMPVMAREASVYTAVTVAEYFRDMGRHVVIIADSTSRWAEARRELASRTGAIPAEEGYPADLSASLAALYQRAGRVITNGRRDGAVTIVTSVSPPGGDATEPVSAYTQRFVQAVWALDRDLAYARRYPAVSWRDSFSRDSEAIAHWHAMNGDLDWAVRRSRFRSLLSEADRLRGIADLVGVSALPTEERLTLLSAGLAGEAILQQSALSDRDSFCSLAKQAALVQAVLDVHDAVRALGQADVPASVIEAFDFGPLLRAKDTVGSEDADGVRHILSGLLTELEKLT